MGCSNKCKKNKYNYCDKYTTYKQTNCPAIITNENSCCSNKTNYRDCNLNDFHVSHKKHSRKCYTHLNDYYAGSLIDYSYCNLKPNKECNFYYKNISSCRSCC